MLGSFLKSLFSTGTTNNGVVTVGTDIATILTLATVLFSLVSVVIGAISGNHGFWFFTQNELVWILGISSSLLIACRSFISALQNMGISANQGEIVKVTNGLSTIVGLAVTALMWVSSAWSSIATHLSSLGVSPGTTAAVGGVIAATLVIFKAIQGGLQNSGVNSVTPPAPAPAPAASKR